MCCLIIVVVVVISVIIVVVVVVVINVVVGSIVVFWGVSFVLLLLLWFVMSSSKQERGNNKIQRGAKKLEQLLGKMKGGNYVSKCEDYGVFVFVCFILFVCAFFKQNIKNRGFNQYRALFFLKHFWLQKTESISGPH